jgi:pseudouridine-5'-phosphate glycosidase
MASASPSICSVWSRTQAVDANHRLDLLSHLSDAFAIMRAMGRSTMMVSQKYVHPTPEMMQKTFERLNAVIETALASLPEGQNHSYLLQFLLQ